MKKFGKKRKKKFRFREKKISAPIPIPIPIVSAEIRRRYRISVGHYTMVNLVSIVWLKSSLNLDIGVKETGLAANKDENVDKVANTSPVIGNQKNKLEDAQSEYKGWSTS